MNNENQMDLYYDSPLVPSLIYEEVEEEETLSQKFTRFHNNNPQVYKVMVSMAKAMRSKNPNRKLGIAMLYEVIRWNYYMTTASDDEFKLNNDFKAPYARLIMQNNPDLEGAFEIRKSVMDS
jgi:hypothetical protein